jgi:hypothetical protein
MSERKARIDLTNLPLRPRHVKPEELQNVFGGCYGYGNVCMGDSDCCSNKCRPKDFAPSWSPIYVIACICY